MRNLLVAKTITTIEEYKNSKEVAEQFSYYASSELERHLRIVSNLGLVEAYVIKTEPSENYGRKSKVFFKHLSDDGLIILSETTATSMMHNGNLYGIELVDGVLTRTGTQYTKSKEGRSEAIRNGVMVWS